MQMSWVAGFADGLYLLNNADVQIGSEAARGDIIRFFAARYAASPVVPTKEDTAALNNKPIVRKYNSIAK